MREHIPIQFGNGVRIKKYQENEDFYPVGYSTGNQSTFRRNMSPPSSGSKNTPRKKPE
jgi:hypothetical protein